MITLTNVLCLFMCVLQLSTQVHTFLQWRPSHPAFDASIYQDALDPGLCEIQLEYLRNNTLLRLQFLDAGAKIPKGILIGNKVDLGNYYQCLGLTHPIQGSEIQGKFCLVKGTLTEDFISNITSVMFSKLNDDDVRSSFYSPLNGTQFRVAVCVPKTCTSNRGFQGLVSGFNLDFRLQFEEEYCRLPNDKPWAPVDYVTIGLLSIIGLLTAMSTFYDLYYTKILDKDPKQLSKIYRSFSVYTNTRYLLTFNSNPGSLDCLDGIRALATAWVIIGHSVTTQPFWLNPKDTSKFHRDWTSLWLTAAPLAVDTFFMLSGLLLVYTTAGKVSGTWVRFVLKRDTFGVTVGILAVDSDETKLLKNIHRFYTNRLLRLFPILAAGILLEASKAHRVSELLFVQCSLLNPILSDIGMHVSAKLLKNIHRFYTSRLLRLFPILAAGILLEASIAHRVLDGPYWQDVANHVDGCRTMWWVTLLHIQNYVSSGGACLGHTWYLAVDVQLHILSPIVLVWVAGRKRRVAWIALAAAILVSLTSATIYNFTNKFLSALNLTRRHHEIDRYMKYYYTNTLTRAPPFFVGMLFGYVLHIWREKKIIIHKFLIALGILEVRFYFGLSVSCGDDYDNDAELSSFFGIFRQLYVAILWIFTLILFTMAMFTSYPSTQSYLDNQIADSMVNSFQRPAWALGLGWLILACVYGYGGPINWLLSLQMWKLLARISYGMYILHWSLMAILNGSRLAPAYFSVKAIILNFLCQYSMTFIVAFIVTVVIDSPFSILFKIILRRGEPGSCKQQVKNEEKTEYDSRR